MTDDNYGTAIVAIPIDLEGFPEVAVEGGPHVTLAYFGDEPLDNESLKNLIGMISHITEEVGGPFMVDIDQIERFGEDGSAVALALDDSESKLEDIRDNIIQNLPKEDLRTFLEAQTWPVYRPHMTLGYTTEGYKPPLDTAIPSSLFIGKLAVWSGPSIRHEFDLVEEELAHYGMPRRSGRYPWGSGQEPFQNTGSFLAAINEYRAQGYTEGQIATALLGEKATTTDLRALTSIARAEKRAADIAQVQHLKDRGLSNVAIANKIGVGEATVRNYLKPGAAAKASITRGIADTLREEVGTSNIVDVGHGVDNMMGVSKERLNTAVAMLKAEGYEVRYGKTLQLGTGHETSRKVLAPPGTSYSEAFANPDQIRLPTKFSEDGGREMKARVPPRSIDSNRVAVRYAEEGGAEADGLILVRPGVEDLTLGGKKYAQVRVQVDGTHYLKGMAAYSDDMPAGKDIVFHTNKSRSAVTNDKEAMKPVEGDELNPFGSSWRPKYYTDKDGNEQLSGLAIVNEEGDWAGWSKRVSSQMLSKQRISLAKEQLNLTAQIKREELDEILSLTNPTVKQKLLESYADGADSAAVSLKAAAMPRSSNHVIMPVNSLKETEVYAPGYRNGEELALVRHPHGGIFEIPTLRVNNRNPDAKSLIGNATDAIAINSKVAQQLSGADFDGDTVLVIPTAHRRIATSSPLEGLKDFDPRTAYPPVEGMKKMTNTQNEMGKVSNLITDMTIRGATETEIAAAVRHSMVVIDAEKHGLNYQLSYERNRIAALKERYQSQPDGGRGASTIISRASSEVRVPQRKPRLASEGGPIDPTTGELQWTPTGKSYVNARGVETASTTLSTRMAEAKDAHTLTSGTPIEAVYADYANNMKSLANEARRESLKVTPIRRSETAAKTYAPQVETLVAQLNRAKANAPLERLAQAAANAEVREIRKANPHLDKDDLKKAGFRALDNARDRVGAKKQLIAISDKEWEAIQAGAVSPTRLSEILAHADLDRVKALATPRSSVGMPPAKAARAKSMMAQGYTQAEVAEALGVSTSAITEAIR